jgi:hypothetical protein
MIFMTIISQGKREADELGVRESKPHSHSNRNEHLIGPLEDLLTRERVHQDRWRVCRDICDIGNHYSHPSPSGKGLSRGNCAIETSRSRNHICG